MQLLVHKRIIWHADQDQFTCFLFTAHRYPTPKIRALHHHNRFTALFPAPPGWVSARRELLDFMVQGKINRGRHTDHPAERHSIRTNQCPLPSSPHFLQAGCPSCRPTNSVKALNTKINCYNCFSNRQTPQNDPSCGRHLYTHVMRSLKPPDLASQTASQLVQPFMHNSRQWIPIHYNTC